MTLIEKRKVRELVGV